MTRRWDVVIVGAGAAGLAAARALRDAGARVLVIEGRDCLGGRVRSLRSPTLDLPVELGAEFIHGLAPRTLALAAELRLPVVDIPAAHFIARDAGGRGRLSQIGSYYDELEAAMDVLARPGPDASVSDRLRALRSSSRRMLALDYVRGFEAADPERASASAMAESVPSGDQRRQLRLVSGYGPLIEGLARGTDVRLGHVARAIAWRRGEVEIGVQRGRRRERLHARRALVTVPVGVLQAKPSAAAGIALDGELRGARAAIDQLAMGHVVRLAMHVEAPLGELLGCRDASFVHAPGRAFPAWWSPVPMRTPIAVAWIGGPPAVIDDAARARLVEVARRELRWLGVKRPVIHAAWCHDWRHDPFARGAYAFPLVGGAGAGERLARSIDGTLYFAGEATSADDPGTVEGAIQSGERAARAMLRAG